MHQCFGPCSRSVGSFLWWFLDVDGHNGFQFSYYVSIVEFHLFMATIMDQGLQWNLGFKFLQYDVLWWVLAGSPRSGSYCLFCTK